MATEIWEIAGKPCSLYDVWVDLPKLPPTGTADDTYVRTGTQDNPDFEKLSDIFKVDDWAEDYTEHKWRGHVFCPNDNNIRKKISNASVEVFKNKFGIEFKSSAQTLCKI